MLVQHPKRIFLFKLKVWPTIEGDGDVGYLAGADYRMGREYDDASFTITWGIDLHYPKRIAGFKEEPFRSYCNVLNIRPYAVPYRCLYSRNVDNLFMAGRNISVTHVALGTVRVMRTGGMMGEVVGVLGFPEADKLK